MNARYLMSPITPSATPIVPRHSNQGLSFQQHHEDISPHQLQHQASAQIQYTQEEMISTFEGYSPNWNSRTMPENTIG